MTSNASTVSTSQETGGPKTLLRHWSWAMARASSSVGRPAEVDLQAGGAATAGLAVGVEDLLERLLRLVDGDQAVRPRGVAGRGLGGDGRADEVGDGLGQRPQPGAVDVDEAVVADLLAGEQASDDVDALDEALVAHLLARPHLAGDPLVGGLARSERRPEATREHLRERRDGLGDDRGVVALPGGVDDAERQAGRGQRGAEEGPGEAGLSLPLAPRAEVVRGHGGGEAGLLGVLDVPQELGRVDLLVRTVESDDRHPQVIPACNRLQAACARSGLAVAEREEFGRRSTPG